MRTFTFALLMGSTLIAQPVSATSDHVMSALVHYFAEKGLMTYKYAEPAALVYLVYDVVSNAYQQAVMTPNVASIEHRLLELEASINGFVAQRHAQRSELGSEAKEALWNIVDELLELRSRSYDLSMSGSMTDELQSITGKAEALADRAWALSQ